MAAQRKGSLWGLYSRVSNDPDIENPREFEKFVNDSSVRMISSPTPSIGFQRDSVASKVRPGIQVKMISEKESLRNSPGEKGEFEVSRTDSIPLRDYRRMSRDPAIQLTTLLFRGWIAGLKYDIASPDPQVSAVVNYVLRSVFAETVRNLLSAIVYGFAFGEKVWQRENVTLRGLNDEGEEEVVFSGQIVSLRKIKFIDPDEGVRFFKDRRDEISRVEQDQSGSKVSVKRRKLLWFALDKEFSNIFGRSRFKNVYDAWYSYQINQQQMLRHVQRTGSPPLKIRYPNGTSYLQTADAWLGTSAAAEVPNVQIAEDMAKTYLNHGACLLPSERDENGHYLWDLEFDTVSNTETSPFTSVLSVLAARMSEGLGVPSALTVGESNFAEANAQAEMLLVVVEDLVDQLEGVITSDLIRQIVEFNFGPEAVPSVSFTIEKSGLGRRKLFKDIFINTLRTLLSRKDLLPVSVPDLTKLGREMNLPMAPLIAQTSQIATEEGGLIDGSEEVRVQQDEDSNDPLNDRLNETDSDAPEDSAADKGMT